MNNAFQLMAPGAGAGEGKRTAASYEMLQIPNFIFPGGQVRRLTENQKDQEYNERAARVPEASEKGFYQDFVNLVPGIGPAINQLLQPVEKVATKMGVISIPRAALKDLYRAYRNNKQDIAAYKRYHAARALKYFKMLSQSLNAATLNPEIFTERYNKRQTQDYKDQQLVSQAESRAKKLATSDDVIDTTITGAPNAGAAYTGVSNLYENIVYGHASNPSKASFERLLEGGGALRSLANMGARYEALREAAQRLDTTRISRGRAAVYAGEGVFYAGSFGRTLSEKLQLLGVPPSQANAIQRSVPPSQQAVVSQAISNLVSPSMSNLVMAPPPPPPPPEAFVYSEPASGLSSTMSTQQTTFAVPVRQSRFAPPPEVYDLPQTTSSGIVTRAMSSKARNPSGFNPIKK